MIKRITSDWLSASMHTASHNRPLVLAGEQVQRGEKWRVPAATGAVGVRVVCTSAHLSFPLLLVSFILLPTTREQQCQAWARWGQWGCDSQTLTLVEMFPCAGISLPATLPITSITTVFPQADLLSVFPSTTSGLWLHPRIWSSRNKFKRRQQKYQFYFLQTRPFSIHGQA